MKKVLVIGSLNMDYAIGLHHMPDTGETSLADSLELIPGGKGANQAFALGRLGADVTMLGAVGDDGNGSLQLENLARVGVDVSHIKVVEGVASGLAIIPVDANGDNRIIVIQGANKEVSCAYIDEKMDVIRGCDIVLFQLEIPLETVVYAAKAAKALGKTVILDPAPAPSHLPAALLRCVDYIKPNETELAQLTGVAAGTETLPEACGKLIDAGVGCVLATLGGEGVYVFERGGIPVLEGCEPVKVVDTTAAGDSFLAAVAFRLAAGQDILSACRFANKVATRVVTVKGAQSSIPSYDEVMGE